MSVKNYSSRLLDIFKLASEKEFVFDCKTVKAANALRHRLHALRREMRAEKHWMVPAAEAVVISLKGTILIAHPPDNQIDAELAIELKKQGLKEIKLDP